MTRFRWLNAQWSGSIRSLSSGLKSAAFNQDNSEGFVIDRVRDDFLEARYVERIDYSDSITDPFGNELVFPRVEFRQCEFVVSQRRASLELIDPPRNIQGMLSRLAIATDFTLSISPLKVDVLAWAGILQSTIESEVAVDSLQVGSVELSQDVRAKIIVKGRVDVRNAASSFLGARRYSLEKIQLRIKAPFNGTVLLSDVGVAKVDLERKDEFVLRLRASLDQLLASDHKNKKSM